MRREDALMQIISLFGKQSITTLLRGGLEEQSATQRGIASRISSAQQASASADDFATELSQKQQQIRGGKPKPPVDLTQEMGALADVQIRYETSARLLHDAYAKMREAIKSNG